jgi:hypothetical protein
MNYLEQHKQRQRYYELDPIRSEMNNDPIIRRIADEYIYGNICTLTECLFQMVKHTSTTNRQRNEEFLKLLQYHSVSQFPPP